MRRARSTRFAALIALAWATGSTGCIHNHYYGYTPAQGVGAIGCEPASGPMTSSVGSPRLGAACDVPPASGGAAVSSTAGVANPSPIISHARAPGGPMIVSTPIDARRLNPFAWRRQDTQSLAQTHVDGAYEDETVIK